MPKQVGNVQLMQKMNRLKVLNYIRRNPDISRPVLSEKTGLSLASITNVTTYLLDIGLLIESGIEPAERVGRKSILLRFNSEAYGLIFASISEDEAEIFYTNLEGKIISSHSFHITDKSAEQFISVTRKCVGKLIEKYGREHILAVGINFSGLVLDGNRFVLSSSMKWKELDIKKIFEDATGLPVFVENISKLRAVWYSSSHKDTYNKNVIFVDLDNGIGAVQVVFGAVNSSVLGEIGHTTVEKDGVECFCGNRGCLEAMCSAERIVSTFAALSGNESAKLDDISSLYDSGDVNAQKAISECAAYLGMGLSNLVSLFHPDVIVINEGQFSGCRRVSELAVIEMQKRTYPALWHDTEVRYVDIDLRETIAGAAFETCDSLFDISFEHNPVE